MLPRLLTGVLGLTICAATFATDPAKLAAFGALPATNPYREILLRVENLPAADRDTLKNWLSPAADAPAPTLTADQRAIIREVASALRSAAAAPPATAADWPLIPNPDDPDNPAAIILVGVGSMRELARLAVRAADDLPPADAIDTYAAIAQLGRQQRAGATLIEQLNGVAIEGIAQAEAARRLGDFSAADLQHLSSAWLALAPAPSLDRAIAGERDVFFKPILDKLVVPGLRELLAANATGDEPAPGDETDSISPDADFTRYLRLSGLANLGEGELRISLENTRTGESFTLRLGSTVEGVELVSLDFEKRLAVIRQDAREAVIHLESKRIVPKESAALRLRKFFAVFDSIGGKNAGLAALRQTLAAARAHPEGVDGYARDLFARYQSRIDQQLSLANSPRYPADLSASEVDPILALTMPAIGKVARTLHNSATQSTMLQAAVQLRLRALGQSDATPPADPWSGDGSAFAVEKSPDGGFLLRSHYETRTGKLLTYKFAAPDAGFVRVP